MEDDPVEVPTWQNATGRWFLDRLNKLEPEELGASSSQRTSPRDVQSLERVAKSGSTNIYFNESLEARFRIDQRLANRLPRVIICAMAVFFYGSAPFWAGWVFSLPPATQDIATRLCLWLIVPVHLLAGIAQFFWVTTEVAEVMLLIGFCMQIIFIELLRVHASFLGLHLGPILTAATPISVYSMLNLSLRRRLILFATFLATLLCSYLLFTDPRAQLSNGEWFGAVLIVMLSLTGSIFFQISVRRGWAANSLLEVSAGQDVLTGLANRFAFINHVESYLRIAKRYDKICMLALVDLDHFKKVNDHYGHTYGDGVLMEVGLCLNQFSRRAGDIVARVGGEEFAVFLYDCSLEGAKQRLDELSDGIRSLEIDHDANMGGIVTASVGAVMMSPSASLSEAYQTADTCLYQAKDLGRNRIIFGTKIV